MNRPNKNDKSGFTLLELLTVIAIVAIISGIAIPNLLSWLPKSRLRAATRDIVSCFQEMKIRAIKENANTVIVFSLANDQYTAFVDNGPGVAGGNWALDATEAIIQQENIPAGLDIYNSTFNANTFGFNGRGLPASIPGTVFITHNNTNYRCVIVNFAGNIRVQRSSDGMNWN